MKKILTTTDQAIYWVETLVSTFSLIAIIIIVFWEVVLRYFMGKTIPWGEEVIIALIITMAMFGAARGVRLHSHTEVTGVANALPKWGAYILRFITTMITIALMILTVYASFFLANRTKSVTVMLRMPQKWIYYFMGTGAGLTAYELLKIAKARILGDY